MSETEKSKKKTPKRIVDVERPGTSAPAATSKPVIVTNRPLLQDPMMVAKTDDESETKDNSEASKVAVEALKTSDKQTIKPLEPTLSEDEDEDETTAQPGDAESSDDNVTMSAGNSESALPKGDDTNPSSETPPPDTSKSGLAKQAEAEAAAKAKHDTDVQQLIESKQYVLPINTVEKRKSKRFVLLGIGLAIILIIIWLDIALDAGIIKLGGLKPLTHFFSN